MMPITIGSVMNGPMPTISVMLIAVACKRPKRLSGKVSAILAIVPILNNTQVNRNYHVMVKSYSLAIGIVVI